MSYRNGAFIAILSILAGGAGDFADEPSDSASETPARTGVLLFRSGRALEGQLIETETHFVVVRTVGKVEVPKTEIEMVGRDFEQVYRHKRARINNSDPDEHFRLAQWCLLVNLRELAIEELERTGELSNPARVKGMIESIRRAPLPRDKPAIVPANAANSKVSPPPATPTYRSFQKELTPPMISSFTVQIQPLLNRGCGSAGCHDSAHNGPLTLQRSALANQRTTQLNLRSVLSQVDADDPDQSLLLAYAVRPHGGTRLSPLGLSRNDAAFMTLTEWVRGVVGRSDSKPVDDKPVSETVASSPPPGLGSPSIGSGEVQSATGVKSNKPLTPTISRMRAGMFAQSPPNSSSQASVPTSAAAKQKPSTTPTPSKPPGTIIPARSTTGGSVSDESTPAVPNTVAIRRATDDPPSMGDYQPVDPFDPEIFNRQFAPR